MPYGLHLPTTFSATSLTAFSNDSYRSVIGVDMLLHWRKSNLLDSSSWICSFVAASWMFLPVKLWSFAGFTLELLRLQTSLMLTIRWSESSSTELQALQFRSEFFHLLLMRMWSNWCVDPDGWIYVQRRCLGWGNLICAGRSWNSSHKSTSLSPLLLVVS